MVPPSEVRTITELVAELERHCYTVGLAALDDHRPEAPPPRAA